MRRGTPRAQATNEEEQRLVDTPHTKRQEQAMARREQLVWTALRLFSEKGYRGASVRDIARAAGVNEGLLYHYFSGKGDLFRAVLDEYAPVRASPRRASAAPVVFVWLVVLVACEHRADRLPLYDAPAIHDCLLI